MYTTPSIAPGFQLDQMLCYQGHRLLEFCPDARISSVAQPTVYKSEIISCKNFRILGHLVL